MTSNIGSTLIRDNFMKLNEANHDEIMDRTRNQVTELLKQTIRPEFLNRVDELIMFAPLTKQQIEAIVKLQIASIQKLLEAAGITLELSEEAFDFIASEGYDPQYGARPVKRAIQRFLLNELSKSILAGTVDKNSTIQVERDGATLRFSN
jgi:ATP-dependent Clp protease ATP-binding subunit ClpB